MVKYMMQMKCHIHTLRFIPIAGTATDDGINGADLHLRIYGKLPGYYITMETAKELGYKSGYRGRERILFSNDGLIFVTYDHYYSFVEIE